MVCRNESKVKMKLTILIKNAVSSMPYSVGKYFTNIPYSWRLGPQYTKAKNEIKSFMELSEDEQLSYTVIKLNHIIRYAYERFPFYRNLYQDYGVETLSIKYLDEFEKFPILTKKMIRGHTNQFSGALSFNTGGTTGEPFCFYLDGNAFAREWAHMHYIWALKDYNKKDIKITFRGKNLGSKNIIYNPVHNEFIVNTYKSVKCFKAEFLALFSEKQIKYIHGYPSAVYEFFKELYSITTNEERLKISNQVRCCFFGSEFPVPYMVDFLETKWGFSYISWYGHSEMAILAYDKFNENKYFPMMTYGFAEVVGDKLLGSSYNNFDMPLIRYDTGDRVEGQTSDNGLLKSFSILEGREGDFIVDLEGKKISLTALVFGRHHKIFDIADFIQVSQINEGPVVFHVTIKDDPSYSIGNIENYFELSNVKINCGFKIIDKPIRSKIGKIKLKIE